MKQKKKAERSSDQSGSALVIAIVVMMVVMMLSLALLLVSFSLFNSANKQQTTEQCKEIAQGISRELELEITGKDVNFKNAGEMEGAMTEGKNPLWFYLRCNLHQENWPYYNSEESFHSGTYAYRYFDLASSGSTDTEILDGVTVKMYWESEDGADKRRNATLVIQVTCEKLKQKSTITTSYELAVEDSFAGYGAGSEMIPNGACNPGRNTINTGEKWTFTVSKRE